MSKAKKEQSASVEQMPSVPCVVLTVETLMNLMDRVTKLEARLAEAEQQAQDNFDWSVEHAACTTETGAVVIKAMPYERGEGEEDAEIVLREAPVPPLAASQQPKGD